LIYISTNRAYYCYHFGQNLTIRDRMAKIEQYMMAKIDQYMIEWPKLNNV